MSPGLGSDRGFTCSGFFAIRTPLLPFDEFLAWSDGLEAPALDPSAPLEAALSADRARLRDRLCALIVRPLIRDALFVASPDLEQSLDVWTRDPDGERGRRIERALVRYFARMVGRPTPFGLFAGSSVGVIGARAHLVIESRESYQRHTRLDMDYLFGLAEAIGRDPVLRKTFAFHPNSSLYRAAGRVHYVEARLDGKNRTHHLVAVEDSEELQKTLTLAAEGASLVSLAAALVEEDVSRADAEEFVGELIQSQILLPDLDLCLTGGEPAKGLATQLRAHPETAPMSRRLEDTRTELSAIDAGGLGADPARYRTVGRQLEELPAPVDISRLFQVDMIKPASEASLGGAVLAEIVRGVALLHRLAHWRKRDDLARFREAFVARYQGREVPVVEALDEEAGIGFPPTNETDTGGGPLLKDLGLAAQPEQAASWGARERWLLRELTEATARGVREIVLQEADLRELESKDPPSLPGAFAVLASVAAASEQALSRGEFRVLLMGIDGPSGARLLGRFSTADSRLRDLVERHLRAEEALDPEAVFAEIVHLPEGRLGNILIRPVLRDYEIPYLGRSGASRDRQIPVTDLLVSVSCDRVVLRSARLNRRIVPRLTSAHNFRRPGLPLYRLLCELQAEGTVGALGWDWGPLGSAPLLPRVSCGRLVLSPARWTIGREELRNLGAARETDRFRVVRSWRADRSLPRLVLLAEGDHRLPIDLANVLSVESFVHLVKDREEATLTEMLPPDELCARGPEGRFVHELIVPFVATSAAGVEVAHAESSSAAASQPRDPAVRRFTPGSEWLYAKLYTGPATADHILRDLVEPLVREALGSGAADRWFFIRYGDPDWHLRLRLRGPSARLVREVLPAVQAAAAGPVGDGRVWKVQLDTYEPEIERYGGREGMELAERIFQVDSEAVLEILDQLEEGDKGEDERWRLALRSVDVLLGDFGFDLEGRREFLSRMHREFVKELGAGAPVSSRLSDRFRKESRDLELLLDPRHDEASPLEPGLAVLRARSEHLVPLVRELKSCELAGHLSWPVATLASSYLHMHLNRLLRSGHRLQEMVLYDFLARLYQSRTARARAHE